MKKSEDFQFTESENLSNFHISLHILLVKILSITCIEK